jgi:hypothetical protein
MPDLYRVRVKRSDIEVEVESTNRDYVLQMLNQYLDETPDAEPREPRALAAKTSSARRPLSLGEFIRQINPGKKNEVAASIAYFLEFHAEPTAEEWRPDEIGDRFTEVRKPRPANMTDLLVKSNFFMDGREKGTYRLSETGVRWIEERLPDNAG